MDRFADAAGRLAGMASLIVGWRPEEFWRATPAELGAVAALLAGEAAQPLTRAELDALDARTGGAGSE